MLKKRKYEIVNNQEDEDGYSFYPDSVIIYKRTMGKRDFNSIKNTSNTESGSPEFAMVSSGASRRFSQPIPSPSAKAGNPIDTKNNG